MQIARTDADWMLMADVNVNVSYDSVDVYNHLSSEDISLVFLLFCISFVEVTRTSLI